MGLREIIKTMDTAYPYQIRCVVCVECKREFNLENPHEAADWYYGHDCEAQ